MTASGRTVLGLVAATIAAFSVTAQPPAASGGATATSAPTPQQGVWIAYEAFGNNSRRFTDRNGNPLMSVGDLRWPVLSLNLVQRTRDGRMEADLATPRSFDEHYLRAEDVDEFEDMSGSSHEDREQRLEKATAHHRPALRLQVDADGETATHPSARFERHQACARRLLRDAIAAQTREPENRRRRGVLRSRLGYIPHRTTPPVETASLLLRLAFLPLPADPTRDVREGLGPDRERDIRPETQTYWMAGQIRQHGRAVGLEVDLRADRRSAAARLCRSLPIEHIARPRSDRCTIGGIVDRRDGWPLTIHISRQAEGPNFATEGQVRIFTRLAPLEGFVPPDNPCS